jgi:flagellar biosynthesis protein FliP
MKYYKSIFVCMIFLMTSSTVFAATSFPALTITDTAAGAQTYSLNIQVLIAMTALTFIPAIFMLTTSFTRIIVVLAILRQALGTAQTPTNQVLLGLALFLTFFVMTPVFEQINTHALQPYMQDEITMQSAYESALKPLRMFMLNQTRDNELQLFARLSGHEAFASADQLPITVIIPAFVTSELKTAFQIGFLIFIPFLIIDLVVASVLMSMGMMMMSPMIISLPFKLMLFVLVDGWTLIMTSLAGSFYM